MADSLPGGSGINSSCRHHRPTPGENSVTSVLNRVPIRRALISVYDKTGLEELATGLHAAGVAIVSTGSTAARIAAAGVPVTEVSELTGFPECLDGRVKTLHPMVHAGILADRRLPDHVRQLEELHVEPFDLVVVNLYPFVDTVKSGAEQDAVVEQIDIGGPSMVRAAAKNHPSVAVVVDPAKYADVVLAAAEGGFTLAARQRLAAAAFAHTAAYDNAVASWTASQFLDEDGDGVVEWPAYAGYSLERSEVLRYGENPHQQAALYVDQAAPAGIAQADQLHGKAMSYNNFVDADAALRAAFDFDGPAVAVVKHANPCGVAVASADADDPIADAHRKAHACDPVSAYGGVIAANRTVTAGMARTVKDIFTEVVIAPDFAPEAVEILSKKKNVRLLALPDGYGRYPAEVRQVSGGMLVQVSDRIDADGDNPANWTLAAGPAADESTLAELKFAWTAVRAAKSNAILLAKDGATVGIGMGQVNRVDSCRLAVERANTLGVQVESTVDAAGGAAGAEGVSERRAVGSVAASDAFFPFADGLQILLDAGVSAVVQPGGSIRDEEVIAAANAAGVTMYFTGSRHFFH
ncbi:bifunctional phosphoribosylaminoimidazolecarboxamide formyltransferase/IMP cyclohydrolase [Arthrobacter sp. SDTb3-6]|nr:bifunctional phosphoribosylaminoimidazolecarboxamide formyltransferase/IMP cyclohydrolase [Arthrobacter sp. SDTb3-6]